MKFIHITDTHLVPPGETLCALDPAARLNSIVDEINRLHSDAAFVVHTGDLSYHGLEPAYRAMRDILNRIVVPCHLLIGNHDDRESFKRIFTQAPVDENGFVQYVVPTPVGMFIMLDSVAHGEEHGTLCEQRLAWLTEQLERYRTEPVYVFLHHPPFAIGIRSLDASKLRQGRELGAALRRHGNVRHLFYGHVHRGIAGSWCGIPTSTLPGTNHQVALYLGEQMTMIGSHEASAYGVCLIDDDCVVMHFQDPLDRSPRFVLTDPASKKATTVDALTAPPQAFNDAL